MSIDITPTRRLTLAFTAALLAACGNQAPPAGQEADALGYEYEAQPHARLADVMRGLLYPSSEVIFDAQTSDPEADQDGPAGAGPGSYGQDLYGGSKASCRIRVSTRSVTTTASRLSCESIVRAIGRSWSRI